MNTQHTTAIRNLFKIRRALFGAFIVPLALTACGGGGGSDSDVLTGQFVDAPVAGLQYHTASLSGETNANGEFSYRAGETVSFYVGDILIGQAAGASTISPFDLAGEAPPRTAVDIRRAVNRINSREQGTPLEVAINIAVFLHTLDEDGDPGNGIEIPAAMHTLAANRSLDFDQPYNDFQNDFPFRKLMGDARAEGLWGGSRAIRNPFLALDSLYAGLGLTPAIDAVFQWESDTDGDGTVDYRVTYAYDSNGNKILYESDSGADGTADYRETYAYDDNGNRTLYEEDTDADGTADYRENYAYDANGNKTLYERDSNGDGTVDRRETYAYDANGNLTLREIDSDGDGVVDYRSIYAYDANGNRTLNEEDFDADGTAEYRETYAYDANGNRTLRETDSDGDGTVDQRHLYTFTTVNRWASALISRY